MPTTTEQKPKITPTDVRDRITKQVLELLGRPNDLWRVDVHLYQGRKARVNIWRTLQIETTPGYSAVLHRTIFSDHKRITDSFYLRLTPAAEIIDASPAIIKKY